MDDQRPRLVDILDRLLRERLHAVNEIPSVAKLPLGQWCQLYAARFHPIDFVEKRSLFCRFQQEFEWASRFAAPERGAVLNAVVRQAVDYGLPYVMAKVSPEAATFRQWSSQVTRELCKARGLIRLVPAERERLLVGRWHFRSFLVDLVLLHFRRRLPHHQVVIVDEPWAYWWEDSTLHRAEARPYLRYLADNAFTPYWETFYDSQNIEEQPRRALAMRHLPKKYWSLVPEGAKIDRAGREGGPESVSAQRRLPL